MLPVTPRKSLGQHFLADPNTARKIVGVLRAGADDPVVEIGPGLGALSGYLVERFTDFTAIEVDQRAADHLEERLPGIDVRRMDVLDMDWARLAAAKERRLFVIGNLPYNISSPILFTLFEAREYIVEAVLMLQREVAERLVAEPRTKAYGILSVAAQLSSEPEMLFSVSPNVFRPRPAVTSAVVRFAFGPLEGKGRYDGPVREVVRMAFNQRRKTLRNSLKKLTVRLGAAVPEPWASKRAEEVSPAEFVELADYLTR